MVFLAFLVQTVRTSTEWVKLLQFFNPYLTSVATPFAQSSSSSSKRSFQLEHTVIDPTRTDLCISDCMTLEICAGSAALSAALRSKGLRVLPVDHSKNRHRQRVSCMQLDITSVDAWAVIEHILLAEQLVYVHLAPPCGTATRARERRFFQTIDSPRRPGSATAPQ